MKIEAVRLTCTGEKPLATLAMSLGIVSQTLRYTISQTDIDDDISADYPGIIITGGSLSIKDLNYLAPWANIGNIHLIIGQNG